MASIELSALPELCFRKPPPTAGWVQFDIGLVRVAGDARPSARRLFDLVVPWWERLNSAGHVSNWFFMRKPPDVRLRFLATPAAESAVVALSTALAGAVGAGALASCERGEYCAEETRFGGPVAMDLVHALFTLDSALWYHIDQLARAGRQSLSAEDWLASVFQDLFSACCPEDVVSAWRRLARHVLLEPGAASLAGPLPANLGLLCESPGLPTQERALARAYRAGNARFSDALHGLAAALPQGCPVAEVAATAAFFSFNRHGFPGERSRPLVARSLDALATST